MIHRTPGIVLRSIKYGDSSLIVNIFTRHFGLQTYMVKGVRSSKSNKAAMLQPACILDLVVYHHPDKNFQSIRELQPDPSVMLLHEDVVKNCIAFFAIEVLTQLLTKNMQQEDLYDFCYYFFRLLSKADAGTIGNFPLYFILHASRLSGYRIEGRYSEGTPVLDLTEGRFSSHEPLQPPFISSEAARKISELVVVNDTVLIQMPLSATDRINLLQAFLLFLEIHAPGFKPLKSLPILTGILH